MSDRKIHMSTSSPSPRTLCGQLNKKICRTPYGSLKTTCKTCIRLHAADLLKNTLDTQRKYYKCTRTDCGRSGCASSSRNPEPPEFCIYDFDEAHWIEVMGGDGDGAPSVCQRQTGFCNWSLLLRGDDS